MPPTTSAALLTDEEGRSRLEALAGLLVEAPATCVVPLSAPDGPDGATAVVVDAVALSPDMQRWADRVAGAGGTVLRLGGPPGAGDLPAGEWFVTLSEAARPWSARLPGEWAVLGAFSPLSPSGGDDVLATINVGYTDRPVLTRRGVGAGQVVTCALGDEPSLRTPELRSLLRRLLAGRAEPGGLLGVAIVGYGPLGGMGLHHALAAAATDGLQLVAVCDSSPERLQAAAKEHPGVAAYSTPGELGADPDVHVAIVATPPSTHPELAEALIRAGKHVVCEKPLCFTPAQADCLIELAAGHGVALTVHQNRRWDPDFVAARSVVESGRMGELFNMETFVGGFEHPCRAWHSEVSISGGAIYDWGAHYLDWTLLLMGDDPVSVSASGHKRVWRDVTNEDQVRVRLGWADGREAEFVHSDVAAVRRPKLYLQGTRGTLAGHYRSVTFESIEPGIGYRAHPAHHAEAPAELTLVTYTSRLGLTEERVALPPPAEFAFHANLADHLLLGEPLAVTAPSVRRVVAVLDAAKRSLGAGGVAVELPGAGR